MKEFLITLFEIRKSQIIINTTTSIRKLDSQWNIIDSKPDNIIYLQEILKVNTTIKILDLCNNKMGFCAKNMKYLAELLTQYLIQEFNSSK